MVPQDFTTPDLSDGTPETTALSYQFQHYGLRERFFGQVETIACFEDNSRFVKRMAEPVKGRLWLVEGEAWWFRP